MKNILKQESKELAVIAIFYILTGILLICFNRNILTSILIVLGWILVAIAIIQFYIYFIRRKSMSVMPLIIAIPSLIFGIFFIRDPGTIINICTRIVGVVLVVNGILHIQQSLIVKDFQLNSWKKLLVYSLVLLGIGLLMFTDPVNSLKYIIKVDGVLLFIEGLMILFFQRYVHKISKKHEDDIIDAEATELIDEKEE